MAIGSPHALAREFIAAYEEKQGQRSDREAALDIFGSTFDALFDAEADPEGMSREEALYAILKTDLAHYGQLLEHPFVIDELKSFAPHRWTELAYSGGIKFRSALAQPCDKLAATEVCVPTMPDGAELIVTRSPLVNSNGVIILTNQIMRAVSIYNDTLSRPAATLPNYIKQIARYYAQQCEQLGDGKLSIPQHYHQPMKLIARYATNQSLSADDIQNVLSSVRTIQRQIVCDLSNELQVAVDGPKSAVRPDMALFEACKAVGNCISVSFIKDKNDGAIYRDQPATASTYCPVGMMARLVNQHFDPVRLSARPIHLFRRFFPEPPQELAEIAKEVKETYNEKLSAVAALRDALARDPERGLPHLTVEHERKQIAITRLDAFCTVDLFANLQKLDVQIVSRPADISSEIPNQLFAKGSIDGQTSILGAVSQADAHGLQLKAGMRLDAATITLCPAITESRLEAGWRSLRSYVAMVRGEHSPEERHHLAAALWHAAHTKDAYGTKKSVVAFSLFPEESLSQLSELQFRELQVIGLQYPTNQHRGRHFDSEPVIAEVVEQPIATKDGTLTLKRGIAVEGRFLAPLQQESPSYPVGSFFQATVKLAPPSSAIATLANGTALEIRQVLKYAHVGVRFESKPVSLTIEPSRDGLLVFLNGSPLGLLTPESAGIARSQYASLFSRTKQLTVEATLTSASSNTAILRTDPSTFQSPWQLEARCLGGGREVGVERSTELVREQLREEYIAYVGRAYELDPQLAPGLDLDLHVAQLATADGRTSKEIASLLSTSDTLLKVRPEPGSPAWEFYETHARQYVLDVLRESDASNGNHSPVSPTEPPLHDTYRSYAERVRRANPYVEGGVELDRQVAALLNADGRSRDEEEAILRAGRELVVR